MQPLSPKVRAALKERHPGLTDATIDEAEALLVIRGQLDPARHARRIEKLDLERAELLSREMPHYADVVRSAEEASPTLPKRPEEPEVTITPRTSEGSDASAQGLRRPRRVFRRPPAPD
jgi:hypothetical protein